MQVRLVKRESDGTIQDTSTEHELSEFGGVIPNVGDRILSDTMVRRSPADRPTKRDWITPEKRTVYEVQARYFWPKRNKKYVALVVSERMATTEEIELL